MKIRSLRRQLYDWLIKHWIISAIISSAPAFVFTFIEIFGVNFGLVDDKGAVVGSAYWTLIAVFVVSVIYTFSLAWVNNYDTQVKENGQFVLNRIRESLDAIKDTKLRRFSNYIFNNHGKSNLSPFRDITQPRAQIESILENIQDTLADIFGLDRHEISLSVIYRTDQDPNWQWLYTFNMANDWRLEELINNTRDPIYQIIEGKTTSVFYPSKKIAIEKNLYLPGAKDAANNDIGSIICRDISIDSNKCVQAILSISTYGHQICEEDDDDTKRKVLNLLLPSFERRIKLELALLYIKDVISS